VACGSSNYDGIINAYIRNNSDYYNGNSTIPIQCSGNSKLGPLLHFGLSSEIDSNCGKLISNQGDLNSYFHKDFSLGPNPHIENQLFNHSYHSFGKPTAESKKFETNFYSLEETNIDKHYFGPHLYLQQKY
jgi:hypothetical protein